METGKIQPLPKTTECTHEEWCTNRSAFVVDGRSVCSIHLASACRFSLSLSEVMHGDHSGVVLHGIV